MKLTSSLFLPGDWQLGIASSWSSGLPYSIISRFFAVDDYTYQQFRTRYGYTNASGTFVAVPRNSERNASVLDLNFSGRKNFVIGRNTAALVVEMFNVLNSDDLRVLTYEPNKGSGFVPGDQNVPSTPLQIDGTRGFGRRYQIGFQLRW